MDAVRAHKKNFVKSEIVIAVFGALVLSLSGCAESQTVQSDIRDEFEKGGPQSLSSEEYETEAETEAPPDTSHMMQVTVSVNDSYVREYYQDAEAFLAAYGIEDREPDFYYDNIDGRCQLQVYFNEATGLWCGIRDFYNHDADLFASAEPYGFVFEEQERREWDKDELDDISIDGCRLFCESVKEYQESFVCDENGRVTQFEVSGINAAVPEEGVQPLLQINYAYREDGTLLHRAYAHNSIAFATYSCRRDTYFDALERVVYEDVYITHGNMEYYFFYSSDGPDFDSCLILDYNTGDWFAEWVRNLSNS